LLTLLLGEKWTELHQIWGGHRPVIGAPKEYIRFPIYTVFQKKHPLILLAIS